MKTIEELTISMSQTIKKMTQREKFNLLSEAKIIIKRDIIPLNSFQLQP